MRLNGVVLEGSSYYLIAVIDLVLGKLSVYDPHDQCVRLVVEEGPEIDAVDRSLVELDTG